MPTQVPARFLRELPKIGASTPLLRIERVTLVVLVAVGVSFGVVFVFYSSDDGVGSAVFQLLLTALFALFAWAPATAAVALLLAMCFSFWVGDEGATLVALAIAMGCVIRTTSWSVIAVFIGGFLLSGAAVSAFAMPALPASSFAGALLVAAVSGAVGLILAKVSAREQRLRQQILQHALEQREAAQAERQRIADELHDVIAHDLTVIAMYSRVLEQPIDATLQAQSQRTIKDAADKALSDLRRVVDQAQNPSVLIEHPRETLAESIVSAEAELNGMGSVLVFEESPPEFRLPRLVDGALARIVRESITNALKYGDPGRIAVTITAVEDAVSMTIVSPLPARGRQTEFPSGGYGLVRMTARARQLGGDLTAGPSNHGWCVRARFPLA